MKPIYSMRSFEARGASDCAPISLTRDRDELAHLCDPQDPGYALRRPDFHFLQTFTLAVGEVAS